MRDVVLTLIGFEARARDGAVPEVAVPTLMVSRTARSAGDPMGPVAAGLARDVAAAVEVAPPPVADGPPPEGSLPDGVELQAATASNVTHAATHLRRLARPGATGRWTAYGWGTGGPRVESGAAN